MPRPPSPKIKRYEKAYNAWLNKLFKRFGKFSREQALKSLQNNVTLPPHLSEYFFSKIDFETLARIFNKVIQENDKFLSQNYNKKVKKELKKEPIKTPQSVVELLNNILPQRAIIQTLTQQESINKGVDFFRLEKEKIKNILDKNEDTLKNQLDDFRNSVLFSNPKKSVLFLKKYPEPKYAFTDSMSRTEINNLNRDLTLSKAKKIGSNSFVWVTSQDERVRPTHRKLNYKVFKYDNIPVEYNDYNCRCDVLPVFPDQDVEEMYGISISK